MHRNPPSAGGSVAGSSAKKPVIRKPREAADDDGPARLSVTFPKKMRRWLKSQKEALGLDGDGEIVRHFIARVMAGSVQMA